jgi:prolyl oligopeptidase
MIRNLILAVLFAAPGAYGAAGVRGVPSTFIPSSVPSIAIAPSLSLPGVPGGLSALSALPLNARLAPLEAAAAQAATPEARAVLRAIAGGDAPAGLTSGELRAIKDLAAGLREQAVQDPRAADLLSRLFEGARPPAFPPEAHVDDYHGKPVSDPYRRLEDPNDARTKEWTAAQDAHAREYLAALPKLEAYRANLTRLFKKPRVAMPIPTAAGWLTNARAPGAEQSSLFLSPALNAPKRKLLDPAEASPEGVAALAGYNLSPDGKNLAYALSWYGSDWVEWRVRDVATGRDLSEVLSWSKFASAEWDEHGTGFYYTRYPEPPAGQVYTAATGSPTVFFHRLGTPQIEDEEVHAPEGAEGTALTVKRVGRRLIIKEHSRVPSGMEGSAPGRVWLKDLTRVSEGMGLRRSEGITLLSEDPHERYDVIAARGDTLYVVTDQDAPRGQLLAIDAKDPSKRRVIIPQGAGNEVLSDVSLRGDDQLVVVWTVDAAQKLKVYDLDGGFKRSIVLPGRGSVYLGPTINGKMAYTYSSFDYPDTVFRYDFSTGRSTVFRRGPKVDASKIVVRQIFAASKDGTKVPMFVIHRKGLKLDGTNPTYLYGYGGFGISLTPHFSVTQFPWIEQGGVYVVANLRGGAEYGREWHKAGRQEKKQNVFDDFIAAAERLHVDGYSSPKTLAIGGASNGGLLVGAMLAQRPDLFAAAVPDVGVHDMLRYQNFTVGRGWSWDYGTSETPESFATLRKYSPLHNLKQGARYPATLVTTGDHDDRVVPSHSHKFAAALQAAQGGPAPVLLRVEKNSGHGGGLAVSKSIEAAAAVWAFLRRTLSSR